VFIGQCGGTNPLAYAWQREKRDMLVAMGENDNTDLNYNYCQNINDGRGYTIGKVGFCTGTGDFVIVAACYNDLEPNNILTKYWPALTQYADQYITQNANQGDTTALDTIGGSATQFCADIAKAAADPVFTGCQDAMADADYMSPAAAHAEAMHLSGALTIGFLYDTELNFGEDDDPPTKSGKPGTPGAATMITRANADYGAGLPTDFTGRTWEESRWLGYLIKERALAMSQNRTWLRDMDQDATWEAARRMHTATSNQPESGTDLSMNYDITSAYKAGAPSPTPCWGDPPLASPYDTVSTVYDVSLDKSASATDQTLWKAVGTMVSAQTYLACPANPTP
jgi:chitosanase